MEWLYLVCILVHSLHDSRGGFLNLGQSAHSARPQVSLAEPAIAASQTASMAVLRSNARDPCIVAIPADDSGKPNFFDLDFAARTPAERLQVAVSQLKFNRPELSASGPVWLWQKVFARFAALALLGAAALAPQVTELTVLAVLSLSFLSLASLRVFCLWNGRLASTAVQPASTDEDLPNYTALVPLFGEAVIVADLVSALSAIDYPAQKLQVVIVLEDSDPATQTALAAVALPAHFEIVVVPVGEPQTKPRALNYALQNIRGEFVVVFDAEDVPEPDQLRKAVAVFRSGLPDLACLQARLNVYNSSSSWLTRQFTIEYTMLFDWMLPALQALGLPVPLGGTSNHFRTSDLVAAGAWDPFNVTEDADLGIRLARDGKAVQVLQSTTWEEAPRRLGSWRRQRTRWLKGWMQTYLVHTREPLKLLQDLGLWRFVGFQLLMGGLIVSALVHPWFYGMAAYSAWHGTLFEPPTGFYGQLMWGLGLFNLVTGYVTAVVLGAVAVSRRAWPQLVSHTLLMPIYWLMISGAAYLALVQLITAPYYWEKTEHSARPADSLPVGGGS
jgi:glycosyltransferase XagB